MEIKKIQLLNATNSDMNLSIGSGCIIIKNKKVLLVRNKVGENYKFPGGHILDSENFAESAKRETLEEIRCTVEIIGEPVFYLFKASNTLSIILVHYLANIIDGEPKPNNEIGEVKWFDLDKLPKNIYENVKPELKILSLI